MKVNLISFVLASSGIILVYCGIKDYDPRDVIKWSLGGKKPQTMHQKHKDAETPKVAPGQHPGDMPWTYPNDNGLSSAGDTSGGGTVVSV